MKKTTLLSILLAAASVSHIASADTLAKWTFESSIPTTAGPLAPETGAGSATSYHSSPSAVFSNPAGNGSLESYSANFWSTGDYFQFAVSTLSFEDVLVTWDQTRSSSGPATFSFGWSTNGTDFTIALASYVVPAITWSTTVPDATLTTSFAVNLGAIVDVDNQANVYFRLIDVAATGATGGTGRVDNFEVTAVPVAVPEPSTMAIVGGFGMLALVMAARRRN